MTEPPEHALETIRTYRKQAKRQRNAVVAGIMILVISYSLFRFYVWSCYRQFKTITVAKLEGESLPVNAATLKSWRTTCKGTTAAGMPKCHPTFEQVYPICVAPPQGQQRPRAFQTLWYDALGVEDAQFGTLPCFNGICAFREQLAAWDFEVVLLVIGLMVGLMLYVDFAKKALKLKQHAMAAEMSRALNAGGSPAGVTATGLTGFKGPGGGVGLGQAPQGHRESLVG